MSRATAYLHFRATDVQKAEIVKRAKAEGKTLSAYLLERALDNGSAEQTPANRAGRASHVSDASGSAPVVEPPGENREQFIKRRTTQIYGRSGGTTRAAKSEAEREWRQAHPDTEENE